MSVKRFVGSNSREAMRQVRTSLGDDALILSNRRTDDGVEILAMADDEHGRLTQHQAPIAAEVPRHEPSTAAGLPASPPGAMDFAALSERLLGEMQDMRALLNRQASVDSMPGQDAIARLRQRLWSVGVGPRLATELLATLPAELDTPEVDEHALTAWLKRQLAARLQVPQGDSELLDSGGIIALVGPTGVGKTTTTAKLAARYVMRHGSQGVALVTTDSYRIGAHEQLRIYARLLGVEVHALDAEASLTALLERLEDKRLVIIDTVGMSQRDQRLLTQVARLGSSGRRVRLMLLLNAASHGDTLEDVVTTFGRAAQAAGNRLVDCILTKSDEAARLGPLLDTVIRHGLRLHYVSHGQQVPEDLRIAEADALVEQALSVSDDSPFAPTPDESAPVQRDSRGLQGLSRGLLGQGRSLASALSTLRQHIVGFPLLEESWELADHTRQRQQQALDAVAENATGLARGQADHCGGLGLLWGPSKVSGCDWPSPVQALDDQGRLLGLSWQYHQLGAGQEQRLGWAGDRLGADRHLLSQCPDTPALEWLTAWQLPWSAPAKGNRRVVYKGERLELSRLAEIAHDEEPFVCRLRGRQVMVHLASLPVETASSRGDSGSAYPVMAWCCQLADVDDGQRLGQRYWLSSTEDEAMQRRLLQVQLAHAELPLLTRQAWQRLGTAVFGDSDQALRLGLAAGLAAVALRLDQEEANWAMDVRAQLLGLLGGKAQRKPRPLLEAMLHLFAARDVFRQLGRSGDKTFGH